MSLFSDQINQRMERDQSELEDSFLSLAKVVIDAWTANRLDNQLVIAREALDEILKYYHRKPIETQENFTDTLEQLDHVLRPSGLMVRGVRLDEGWYRNACGPMLGYMKHTGAAVALIPGMFGSYYYKEPSSNQRKRITRRNANLFSTDALCFYQELPMKPIGTRDLLVYVKDTISYGDIIRILVVSLLTVLMGMLEPRIYSLITGPLIKSQNLNLLYGLGTFLVCSAYASGMLNMMCTLLLERLNTKTAQAVEASVMMRLLTLPVSFFRKYSSGELARRAESINTACEMLIKNVVSVGLSSLMSLLYFGQISEFAPTLVVPSVIIILVTIILSLTAAFMQIGISRKRMELSAHENGMCFSIMNGLQKIRLSGSEKRAFSRWAQLYAERARLEYDPPTFLKVNSIMKTAISLAGSIALYSIALQTHITASEYYAFSAAYGRVSAAFIALAGMAASVVAVKPILEMAKPILQTVPELTVNPKSLHSMSESIEISHVSFRYNKDQPCILDDLSVKINAGEYVALVGRTGCGKSTLVRLLLGFEKPEKGTIFYGYHDLNQIDPQTLRKNLGVVMQNGQLFQGDIFSNIAIAAPQLTLEDAWEAAETAGIADDIREMPMGMHTLISEGYGGISGGQKQRLLIARAIAPKPKILIFDEATSALDNKTQKQVSEALGQMGCTRLVIAHRLSTIRQCSRILVLDNGRIAEDGTYDELVEKGGIFADLIERQRILPSASVAD